MEFPARSIPASELRHANLQVCFPRLHEIQSATETIFEVSDVHLLGVILL